MKQIPRIRKGFTNISGKEFKNVREISYKSGELLHNLGKIVAETEYESNDFFYSPNNLTGVYIYQTYTNPTKAYRIYKEFSEYSFNGYSDDALIQSLYESDINTNEFPTGVVTLDGRIIGQEIPYFQSSMTLYKYAKKPLSNINMLYIYRKILEKISYFYRKNVLYLYIHPKNFMLNPNDQTINIIDFESQYIKFSDYNRIYLDKMLSCYVVMVNYLSNKLELDDITGEFLSIADFDSGFEQLENMQKKLKSKNSVII